MIISASRRTDLPAFYSDWFCNRLQAGFVYVRNPMNPKQVSKLALTPDVVDGIVFWTKNPSPMLPKLPRLKEYAYYVQFTLTPYGRDVETNLPNKNDVLVPSFQRLSDAIGPRRVIWRYDPILLSPRYTLDDHIEHFEKLARRLAGYTTTCIVSFLDFYRSTLHSTKDLGITDPTDEEKRALLSSLSAIAQSYGLTMQACAEELDFQSSNVLPARCVDAALLRELSGIPLSARKDPNQRPTCGCAESIDIGMYNTCGNGCRYCYANHSSAAVLEHLRGHDPASPLLFGQLASGDVVKEREMKPLRDGQVRMWE